MLDFALELGAAAARAGTGRGAAKRQLLDELHRALADAFPETRLECAFGGGGNAPEVVQHFRIENGVDPTPSTLPRERLAELVLNTPESIDDLAWPLGDTEDLPIERYLVPVLKVARCVAETSREFAAGRRGVPNRLRRDLDNLVKYLEADGASAHVWSFRDRSEWERIVDAAIVAIAVGDDRHANARLEEAWVSDQPGIDVLTHQVGRAVILGLEDPRLPAAAGELIARGMKKHFEGDPNVLDEAGDNFTPLGHAALHGLGPVVAALLQGGAHPEKSRDAEGMLPMHLAVGSQYASESARLEMLRLLIKAGGRIDSLTSDGSACPLSLAIRGGHTAEAQLLLAAGPVPTGAAADRVRAATVLFRTRADPSDPADRRHLEWLEGLRAAS